MEQELELLPPRRKPNKHSLPKGKGVLLHTNLYEVNIRQSPQLEQFVMDTEPHIQDSGIALIRRILRTKNDLLLQEIGLLTFKGKTLWGTKKVQKPLVFKVPKNEGLNILQDYQILIKPTRSISYNQIDTLPLKEKRQILQIYTVFLKQKIHKMGMRQTTRSRFLQHQQGEDIKGFKVLMCYDLKLQIIQKKMNLLIDVGFRVLSNLNVLEELNDIPSKEGKEAYAEGKSVVTTYNNRAYKIDRLRFDLKPSSTFYHQKKGKNITFLQYFKEYHKINIVVQNQFLIQTVISYMNEEKEGKQVRVERKGFLIPELCRFSASLLDIKQKNFSTFSDLSKKIKIDPNIRKNEEIKLITNLNNSPGRIFISDKCIEVEGFVYDDLTVQSRDQLKISNGNIKSLKNIQQPMKMEEDNWIFVYSNTRNQDEADDFVDDVCQAFSDSSKIYGIKVKDPFPVVVTKPGVENWIKKIGDQFASNKKKDNIKIVLLMLDQREKNYYSELKRYITNTLKLPCQAFLKKTMNSKNRLTICGKILLQVNCKIGKNIWNVPLKHPYWKGKTVMYGGLSVSKNVKQQKWKNIDQGKSKAIDQDNKWSHAVGFVGTYSQDLSKNYVNATMVQDEKELNSIETYEKLMIDWIKSFFVLKKSMPDVIMLYREGLTEKQLNTQGKAEIDSLLKIVSRAKTRVPGYNPQIVYIMVIKKASKRVYKPERSQSTGKFAPHIMKNPIPGTMVFQSISSENNFDFHLTAQNVTEGTTTMTQYQIAYDASEIPEEAIAQFTMEQCYNYPNWLGGIKVPSCLQSADKLSKLVGEHIHQQIVKDQNIQTKPFYL